MSETIGVALVGAGRHGARYARHLAADFPQVRFVGLWRRDRAAAESLAAETGCRAFADYRELIAAPGVDAVIVVVPPALHPDIVTTAAAHGRAVLLEKPAAIDVAAGRVMLASVRAAGIPLMVAQTLRFNGVVNALKAAQERIGSVHALRISQRFEPSRPGWVDDPQLSGGGVMMLTGVHSVDMARYLTGLEADRVSCEIARTGTTTATEDNFCAVVRMASGRVLASIAGSRATESRTGAIEITGTKGTLIGDHALNQAWIVEGTKSTPIEVGESLPTVRETLKVFLGTLAAGKQMPITLEDGLRAVAVLRACYRAAELQRTVEVEPID